MKHFSTYSELDDVAEEDDTTFWEELDKLTEELYRYIDELLHKEELDSALLLEELFLELMESSPFWLLLEPLEELDFDESSEESDSEEQEKIDESSSKSSSAPELPVPSQAAK